MVGSCIPAPLSTFPTRARHLLRRLLGTSPSLRIRERTEKTDLLVPFSVIFRSHRCVRFALSCCHRHRPLFLDKGSVASRQELAPARSSPCFASLHCCLIPSVDEWDKRGCCDSAREPNVGGHTLRGHFCGLRRAPTGLTARACSFLLCSLLDVFETLLDFLPLSVCSVVCNQSDHLLPSPQSRRSTDASRGLDSQHTDIRSTRVQSRIRHCLRPVVRITLPKSPLSGVI